MSPPEIEISISLPIIDLHFSKNFSIDVRKSRLGDLNLLTEFLRQIRLMLYIGFFGYF